MVEMKKLSKEIIRNAEKEGKRIVRNAEKEREKLIQDIREDIRKRRIEERKKARETRKNMIMKERIKANIEGKGLVLRAKKDVMDSIYQSFYEKLLGMEGGEKKELYSRLLEIAKRGTRKIGTVSAEKKDAAIIRRLGRAKVSPQKIGGGIVVESMDGRERIDLSFPTLIELLRTRTAGKLARILFGGKNEAG